MKTDRSRHVTLIPDKPAGVNPSFTAVTPNTQHRRPPLYLFDLLSPESFTFKCCFSLLKFFLFFLLRQDGLLSFKSRQPTDFTSLLLSFSF